MKVSDILKKRKNIEKGYSQLCKLMTHIDESTEFAKELASLGIYHDDIDIIAMTLFAENARLNNILELKCRRNKNDY